MQTKDRFGYADSASMKNFPADFDHLVGEPYNTIKRDISPTLSRRTTRTQMEGGGMQPSPSLHSLGVLGLRPVPPPVPGHAPLLGTPAMQKSLPPTPALSQRGGGPSFQQQSQGGPSFQQSQMMMPVTPALSQRGLVVGPGEMPNNSGPFANGGLHNMSDDSILTTQSAGLVSMEPRAQSRAGMQVQPSLESLGGSRYEMADPFAIDPRAVEPQPMGIPRTHTKLMPGRMSQQNGGVPSVGQPRQARPQTAVPSRPQSRAQTGVQSSRQQSRASGRGSGRGGVVPFTAV